MAATIQGMPSNVSNQFNFKKIFSHFTKIRSSVNFETIHLYVFMFRLSELA